MPTLYNPGKKKGIFFIPSGATVSPTPPTPSFSSTKSLDFDGVDDYIDLGASSTLELIDNFTISFWINTTTVRNSGIIVCGDYAGSLGWKFRTASGKVGFVVGSKTIYSTTNINDASWYHVCATFNATNPSSGGREHILYINGVAEATSQFGSATNPSYSGTIYKQIVYPGGQYFEGGIDEVSAFNYTLLPSDITTLYNSGTPTDLTGESGLVSWYRMGENSTFSSQILMPENTNKDKVSNYSMYFDGANDIVNCGNDFSFTDELTVSAWVYLDTWGSYETIVSQVNSAGSFIMAQGNNNDNMYFAIYQSDGTWKQITVSSGMSTGEWFHFIGIADGSNVRAYINGVEKGTPVAYDGTIRTSTDDLTIGGRASLNYYHDGKIDEVAIWSSDQSGNVAAIYGGGTPPDLTSLSPLAYWGMGEEAIFNSSNWLLPNKAQDVFSRYSMDFDGIDDYVAMGADTSLQPASAFTVSGWIKLGTTGIYNTIVRNNTLAGVNGYIIWINTSNKAELLLTQASPPGWTRATGTTIFTTGVWYHVMGTWDGANIKIYVNGVLEDTTAATAIYYNASSEGYIGAYSSYEAHALIDEVSIFNSAKAIGDLWDGTGKPTDLTEESGIVSWWRMGEDATFNTVWTIPDKIGSNTGTSVNMTNDDLTGDAPGVTGNGVSDNMTIEDRTGDAPSSSNNALSYNMDAADIEEETP